MKTHKVQALLKLSVTAMVCAGIFVAPTHAYAASWTIWGTMPSENDGGYGDASQGYLDSGSGTGTGGSTGGGSTSPAGSTNPDPTKVGKGCAEETLFGVCSPSSDNAARLLTDVRDKSSIQSGEKPDDRAKARIDGMYGTGTWDRMTTAQKRAEKLLVTTELMPPGTLVNGRELIGIVWAPLDSNGKPSMLSDPTSYSTLQSQGLSYGTYGATWKGYLYLMGMTSLANNLSEDDAKSFVLFHEYARLESPGLDHPSFTRLESTFFNSQGFPISTDGLALMNLAAQKGNSAGSTYNAALKDLAVKAGISEPIAAENADPNC
ncbi:MAG: hypothetical protein U0P81_11010 [Holophagaceae bacterium]